MYGVDVGRVCLLLIIYTIYHKNYTYVQCKYNDMSQTSLYVDVGWVSLFIIIYATNYKNYTYVQCRCMKSKSRLCLLWTVDI